MERECKSSTWACVAFILIPRSVNHLQSVRSREELGNIPGEISVLISRVLGENSDDILDVNKINSGSERMFYTLQISMTQLQSQINWNFRLSLTGGEFLFKKRASGFAPEEKFHCTNDAYAHDSNDVIWTFCWRHERKKKIGERECVHLGSL